MLHLLAALFAVQAASDPNVRVLDATSGEPLAGAQVLAIAESQAPVWGELWCVHSVTTDSDGRAFLPPSSAQDPYGWRVVRADGYAISGAMQTPSAESPLEVTLHSSIPARIRLVDFVGRPVPLVHLGLCVGCGHTPDVASAVTGPDGWATLDGVGAEPARDIADVYPVGDGVMTDYLDVDWDAAQAGGYTAHGEAGATLRGRLILPGGEPAGGYFIGTNHRHRGPWTRTDDNGRFIFQGVQAGHCPYLIVRPPAGDPICDYGGSRLGMERLLRIPEEVWGAERVGPTGALDVVLELGEDAERVALTWSKGEVPVEVWDPVTGWSELRRAEPGEPLRFELVAGDYEVEVGGKGGPFPRRSTGRVTVPDAGPGGVTVIEHRLEAPSIVSLAVEGYADTTSITVMTGSAGARSVEFDSALEATADAGRTGIIDHFAVPAEPFGLWIHSGSPARAFDRLELSPVEGEPGEAVTAWTARPEAR